MATICLQSPNFQSLSLRSTLAASHFCQVAVKRLESGVAPMLRLSEGLLLQERLLQPVLPILGFGGRIILEGFPL